MFTIKWERKVSETVSATTFINAEEVMIIIDSPNEDEEHSISLARLLRKLLELK